MEETMEDLAHEIMQPYTSPTRSQISPQLFRAPTMRTFPENMFDRSKRRLNYQAASEGYEYPPSHQEDMIRQYSRGFSEDARMFGYDHPYQSNYSPARLDFEPESSPARSLVLSSSPSIKERRYKSFDDYFKTKSQASQKNATRQKSIAMRNRNMPSNKVFNPDMNNSQQLQPEYVAHNGGGHAYNQFNEHDIYVDYNNDIGSQHQFNNSGSIGYNSQYSEVSTRSSESVYQSRNSQPPFLPPEAGMKPSPRKRLGFFARRYREKSDSAAYKPNQPAIVSNQIIHEAAVCQQSLPPSDDLINVKDELDTTMNGSSENHLILEVPSTQQPVMINANQENQPPFNFSSQVLNSRPQTLQNVTISTPVFVVKNEDITESFSQQPAKRFFSTASIQIGAQSPANTKWF
ncbi:hypothetical protein HDV05_008613 [Chytridiales sp. JEL 0842]|nr:hypothetical protein HDV05_008613 [Chytridiales sp. JEL 0842]